MGKGLLLWLIGIPIPIILLLWIFGFSTSLKTDDRGFHRPLVDHSQGQQSVVHGESARESEEQCQDSSCHPLWHKRETNSLIAFRANARGPRATSGQGHAYSAARDDIPDRPALSANNGRAQCTISKPRRRGLTLHSKTAGPSEMLLSLNSRSWFHIRLRACSYGLSWL